MSPLNLEQKDNLARRLQYMEKQLNDLTEFEGMTFAEYRKYTKDAKAMERTIENIINGVIDISKIALAGEGVLIPETYVKGVQQLGTVGILDEKESIRLADFVKLRNTLAHEYMDLKWNEIQAFLTEGPALMKNVIAKISGLIWKNCP